MIYSGHISTSSLSFVKTNPTMVIEDENVTGSGHAHFA